MPIQLPWDVLPGTAFAADVATRRDAANNCVVSERDYVSSWLTTTRNTWRMLGGHSICMTLDATMEKKIGCDGVFVIASEDEYKYFFFEAKVCKPNFDSKKKPSSEAVAQYPAPLPNDISRFSDQIARQAEWIKNHADDVIAEIFLHHGDYGVPPPNYQELCCTVFPHAPFRNRINAPGPKNAGDLWTTADVDAICALGATENIGDFLSEVVACRVGVPVMRNGSPSGYDGGFPFLPNQNLVSELIGHGIRYYAYFEGRKPAPQVPGSAPPENPRL